MQPLSPSTSSLALTNADFDAFEPARWALNAEVRAALVSRVLLWAKGISQRLLDLGVSFELATEERAPEVGEPAFHILFVRDRARREQADEVSSRVPLHEVLGVPRHAREANLSFRLRRDGVAVVFELPVKAEMDRRNLRGRLSDAGSLLGLVASLESLPDEFVLSAGDLSMRARECTPEILREWLDTSGSREASITIAWPVSRRVVESNPDDLDELLADALVAMGDVYRAVSWAPDNDFLPMHYGSRGERPAPSDRVDHERVASIRRNAPRRRDERADSADELSAPLSVDTDIATASPPPVGPLHSALKARDSARLRSSSGRRGRPVSDIDPSLPVEKGSQVRVMEGPFEGATGVVQELDGRGGARVRLGLLSTRILVSSLNVTREGKERPALASSHRRLNPTR